MSTVIHHAREIARLEQESWGGRARAVEHVLKSDFQLAALRSGQGEVIAAMLAGEDLLVSMPTSWGKSLC